MAEQTDLFPEPSPPEHPLRVEAAALAKRLPPALHFGPSSWTYPIGWNGTVYSRLYRQTGDALPMLREASRWPLFSTVGVDSFFYRPPTPDLLQQYHEVLPDNFRCVMKVWDRITAHTLNSPRERPENRGQLNPDWLNVDLFQRAVLEPLQSTFAEHAGPLVFEFETIRDGMSAAEFADHLHRFFSQLPRGPQYAVEIRNKAFLHPDYFGALRAHNVAHCFNSWTRMPSIGEQLRGHDSLTADFVVTRALLKPGRTYNDAVQSFAPYHKIQEELPAERQALIDVIDRGMTYGKVLFIIANNRFEGSSPRTIQGLAKMFIDFYPTRLRD